MARRYRLNVDFDNSIIPFLYDDTGEYTFTVPSSPNFMGTRYVVFLPCVIDLSDAGHYPIISGYTRIESGIPSTNEFRTIPAADYDTSLLKDGLEFPADSAGAVLTVTNLYTLGSTVDPNGSNSYSDDKKGCGIYTRKLTGVNTDINLGTLHQGEGFIKVNGSELILDDETDIVPSSALTASLWHIVYISNAGLISFEETTDSDYSTFPIAQLDSKAPVNSAKTARYKSGDSNLRAIALVYTLPEQSDYSSGTTYARRDMVVEGTTVYVSISASNTGHTPSSSPTYWVEMGEEGYLFYPKVHNFPESIFGTGALGDVTLDGTGLGATATPLYGVRENVTGTVETYPEYEFNNLTITGTVYAGKSDGLSLDPVVIRVKGTLTIGASGQINGNARGANGGAGGTGTAAGGAGSKSGRPIHIFANKIVDLRTSSYAITTKAGAAAVGSVSGGFYGGSGGGSSSGLIIITNSLKSSFIDHVNIEIHSSGAAASNVVSGRGGSFCNRGEDGENSTSGVRVKGGDIGEGASVGASTLAGGGGFFGGGGAAANGTAGNSPAISHKNLGYLLIIDRYDSREAI